MHPPQGDSLSFESGLQDQRVVVGVVVVGVEVGTYCSVELDSLIRKPGRPFEAGRVPLFEVEQRRCDLDSNRIVTS